MGNETYMVYNCTSTMAPVDSSIASDATLLRYTQISVIRNSAIKKRYMNGLLPYKAL